MKTAQSRNCLEPGLKPGAVVDRTVSYLMLAIVALLPASAIGQTADETKVDKWAVTGVGSRDVLNMRDVPSADSRILGSIPPDARDLKGLGCIRAELPLDVWMRMNKEQRRDAQLLWCRVEYHGKQGWVAGRYLRKENEAER